MDSLLLLCVIDHVIRLCCTGLINFPADLPAHCSNVKEKGRGERREGKTREEKRGVEVQRCCYLLSPVDIVTIDGGSQF